MNVVLSALVIAGAWSTREREALGGVGGDAVGGRDGDRIGAAGAGRRGAGQGGRAVAVVGEGHAAGQRAGLAQGGGREARRWSR